MKDEAFWAKTRPAANGCIEWQGATARGYAAGGISQRSLGALHGLSQQQVSNIVRGAKWKVS